MPGYIHTLTDDLFIHLSGSPGEAPDVIPVPGPDPSPDPEPAPVPFPAPDPDPGMPINPMPPAVPVF